MTISENGRQAILVYKDGRLPKVKGVPQLRWTPEVIKNFTISTEFNMEDRGPNSDFQPRISGEERY
ncbi:hypothetical protein IPM62_01925 [Candidatus Woesebacteria bacterium]|nr:MAG: hypothetical protein IPM62_01925 [Candidatus Woesebacteria bacterium]